MPKSKCIQCWLANEIIDGMDYVAKKNVRSRSRQMVFYIWRGLQNEAKEDATLAQILGDYAKQ